MFSKSLSTALLKQMDEREITQEQLAEICNLSKRFVGDVVRGNAVPRLDTFEKICAGLEVSPEDLLIGDKSKVPDKAVAMRVTQIICIKNRHNKYYYPVCPACEISMEREYQAYCDRCGQKLSWKGYSKARIIY